MQRQRLHPHHLQDASPSYCHSFEQNTLALENDTADFQVADVLRERPQRRAQAPRSRYQLPYVDASSSSRERRRPRKAMAPKPRDNQNYDSKSCYYDAAKGNSRKSDHRSAVDYWRRGTCTASERPCKWPSTGSSMACCRRRTRRNTNHRIDPVRCEMQRSIGPTLRIFRTRMSS